MPTDKRKTGDFGEKIAEMFLKKHSFTILDRDYLKKWGEIDIVAKNKDIIHFVEVKTVSYENKQGFSRGTYDEYEAESNIHPAKLKRLVRTIDTYLAENKYSDSQEYQLDAIVVDISRETGKALIRYIPNIL